MDIQELADKLREVHDRAPDGEKMLHMHLFGIKYAAELSRFSTGALVKKAGIQPSYRAEITKGRNLSQYVELKK